MRHTRRCRAEPSRRHAIFLLHSPACKALRYRPPVSLPQFIQVKGQVAGFRPHPTPSNPFDVARQSRIRARHDPTPMPSNEVPVSYRSDLDRGSEFRR
jgi:hypothetical protein